MNEKIQELAFWKWCEAGKPIGQDQYFWDLAEKEISGEVIEINYRRPRRRSDWHRDSGTGYFYCPYIPLISTPITVTSVMSKYGKKPNWRNTTDS